MSPLATGLRLTRTIDWADGAIVIIDQSALPERESTLRFTEVDQLADAISTLQVRGAMALGVAGGLGVALAIRRALERGLDVRREAHRAAARLIATRPTAANLAWGVERVLSALAGGPDVAVASAIALIERDIETNRAISAGGAGLVAEVCAPGRQLVLLTHCNAGALAAVEVGSALGIVSRLHSEGLVEHVVACETRPLLQGSRLTCWELERAGIPCRLIVDSAAAGMIVRRCVDAVIVGADRIAANGDVANKVGTLAHALAARHSGVPFIVAAPEATIDRGCPDGSQIAIEERPASEVLQFGDRSVAVPGVRVLNPAFDVTPAALVTAIVTETRVIRVDDGDVPGAS